MTPKPTMTPDEIRQRLKEAGIPVGEWGATQEGGRPLPGVLQRQRAILESVKLLLEKQVAMDKAKAAELHETLGRLKHGGGR